MLAQQTKNTVPRPSQVAVAPDDDFDLDGFTNLDGDCNDLDPSIYPGALEVCDGLDNNCDWQIDEDNVCCTGPNSIIRVNHAALSNGPGVALDWSDAFNNLHDALVSAKANGACEIWVAQGTGTSYVPSYTPAGLTTPSRKRTFYIDFDINVYGGFLGNELNRLERDFENNVTVLSGNRGDVNSFDDNVFHVVTFENVTNAAVLDGFTIEQGKADGDNFSGAGIISINGNELIENCIVQENYANSGAGMYSNGGNPTIANSLFQDNTALEGGGVYANAGSTLILGSTFSNNTADTNGGGIHSEYSEITISKCTFHENQSSIGGGIRCNGNAILINCLLWGNSSTSASGGGGGLYHRNGTATVTNCTVSDNTAVGSGGGIYAHTDNILISNSIIWGNMSENNSAPHIYVFNPSPAVTVEYSIMGYDCPSGATCNGIINSDPLFVINQNDYRLTTCSPAVNAGTGVGAPDTDLDKNNRPWNNNGMYDIGAFEFQGDPQSMAPEICDGIDNDCDGLVDEDVLITLFIDTDGDGFGDPNNSIQTCSEVAGYVTDNTDCNDNNDLIYPGASELCDGQDNDCDGQIETNYDEDNDGYTTCPANSLDFDGVNDEVLIGQSAISGSTVFTIEFWALSKYSNPDDKIMAVFCGSNRLDIRMDNGKLSIYAPNTGLRISSFVVPLNTYFHVAITTSPASGLKMYANGQQVLSTNSITVNGGLRLGKWCNGLSLFAHKGNIDEFRIWNIERSEAEIQSTIHVELTGNEPGLVTYYDFNQGVPGGNNAGITAVPDRTGNGYNGTLNAFALNGNTSNWVASLALIYQDNCPSIYNPDQADSDADLEGDACDICPNDADNDIDNDGLCADADNCSYDSNPGQEDLDQDGIGDACDISMDLSTVVDNTIDFIGDLNLTSGNANALTGKLEDAFDKYCNGQTTQAINKLNAFINQVNAFRGNQITNAEADELIAVAQAMIDAMENGGIDCGGGSNLMANPNFNHSMLSEGFYAYPNPATNILYLDLRNYLGMVVSISIYDHLGRQLLHLPEQELQDHVIYIDLAEPQWTDGLYLLLVMTAEGQEVKQFAISR